jgi:hypothetical protein
MSRHGSLPNTIGHIGPNYGEVAIRSKNRGPKAGENFLKK